MAVARHLRQLSSIHKYFPIPTTIKTQCYRNINLTNINQAYFNEINILTLATKLCYTQFPSHLKRCYADMN